MSKRLHSLLATAIWAGLMTLSVFAEQQPTPVILARTDVPNSFIPQAEVRLVRRGEEMVVQSVILPRFPGRVLKKIATNEQENWPNDPNAQTYLATLERAFGIYRDEHDMKTTALVIDFVAGEESTRIDFYFAPACRKEDGITMKPDTIWKSLRLSEAYIQKNQEYILIDAFGDEASEHIKTLQTHRNALHGKTNPQP